MLLSLENFQKSPASAEFRSDTFTTPTALMVAALATASLGDAVYSEDQSTTELEKKVADIAGKESGLFCVSGTLSNQIALRTNLLQPPHAVLCDHRAHIFVHEAGGLPTLLQALVQPIVPKNGIHLTLADDIIPNFVPDDGEIHGCPTKVISLENTLHGMIFPIEELRLISAFCKIHNVRLHLDGARLWNASVATGISIKEYCSLFDSVSLCLSKTLGAPVGSVLVSDKRFIKKANHFRKQNGGGIRQSGVLTLMASIAIDESLPKLQRTHDIAKEVGQYAESIGFLLEHPVHTNFVFLDLKNTQVDPDIFHKICSKYDLSVGGGRIAIHFQISDDAIDRLKTSLKEIIEYAKQNPFDASTTTLELPKQTDFYKLIQNY